VTRASRDTGRGRVYSGLLGARWSSPQGRTAATCGCGRTCMSGSAARRSSVRGGECCTTKQRDRSRLAPASLALFRGVRQAARLTQVRSFRSRAVRHCYPPDAKLGSEPRSKPVRAHAGRIHSQQRAIATCEGRREIAAVSSGPGRSQCPAEHQGAGLLRVGILVRPTHREERSACHRRNAEVRHSVHPLGQGCSQLCRVGTRIVAKNKSPPHHLSDWGAALMQLCHMGLGAKPRDHAQNDHGLAEADGRAGIPATIARRVARFCIARSRRGVLGPDPAQVHQGENVMVRRTGPWFVDGRAGVAPPENALGRESLRFAERGQPRHPRSHR